MKKISILFMLCSLITAKAGFVYQTESSFLTTADMDGDSRLDLVMVDGSNANVRIGYQLSDAVLTWSDSRSLGLSEVTDIACGSVLTNANDLLVVTEPNLNRFNIYDLPAVDTPAVPVARYGATIGPRFIAAMDIAGAGNTTHDDLFVVSVMNGSSPYRAERVRSDGADFSSLGASTIVSAWSHVNEVEYTTASNAVAVMDSFSSGFLRLYSFASGGFDHVDSLPLSGLTNPDYVSLIPQGSNVAHFLIWEPGSSELHICYIEESTWTFSIMSDYDLGKAIKCIQLVEVNGIVKLAVIFDGGASASIYDYDGTGVPTLTYSINPPSAEAFIGFLALGFDDLVAISSLSGSLSEAVSANQLTFSGGEFVSVGTSLLPAVGKDASFANVMAFEGEPFVDDQPHRVNLLRAGDWADAAVISGGVITATVAVDSGVDGGLKSPSTVMLGDSAPTAAYTLVSQLHPSVAVFSFDYARGEEVLQLQVSPSPGTYGEAVEIELTSSPVADIYYRTDSGDAWSLYLVSFTIFKDTDLQYYADTGTKMSVIRTGEYRFSESASELDSDGDSIPDYVELANGLDPNESGLDGDGDGYSDLDELLLGSIPTNSVSIPVDSNRFERSVVYDLLVVAEGYDGVSNELAWCDAGTQFRLYSASGSQHGYAKIPSNSVTATFDAVPVSFEPNIVTIISDSRFDLVDLEVRGTNNQLGVELVGLFLQPTSVVTKIDYIYQGGTLVDEASAWLDEALDVYTNQIRFSQTIDFDYKDTVAALLIERKLADLLFDRSVITNRLHSLFKGRTADVDLDGLSSIDIQGLESSGPADEPAYHIPTLVEEIIAAEFSRSNLNRITEEFYDVCSDLGSSTNYIGIYPLPVDVLREFIYSGVVQSNYLVEITSVDRGWTGESIAVAYAEATQSLAGVSSRTVSSFSLVVKTNSFDYSCPVLYTTGSDIAKSLYTSTGRSYDFPSTFTLQPGALVDVEAYTDVVWDQCSGTDPLEVISLELTAVPVASGTDADGNLIPDDYEELFLFDSDGAATSDLDGDGFSDLQEYLDETDPDDSTSYGLVVADMSPPVIALEYQSEAVANLSIDWPSGYAEDFVFTIEYTGNLIETAFSEDQVLAIGDLDGVVDCSSGSNSFYRVRMRIR